MNLDLALATFFEESHELLEQMEGLLLNAESGTIDADTLHALFRCAHTIKGSAGLFSLDAVVHFTHVVESVLDRLRNGAIHFTPALSAQLLGCKDHIETLIGLATRGIPVDTTVSSNGEAQIQALQAWLHTSDPPPGQAVTTDQAGCNAAHGSANHHERYSRTGHTDPEHGTDSNFGLDANGTALGCPVRGAEHWHLSLRFGRDVLRNGMDPLVFVRYLNNYGEMVYRATLLESPPSWADYDPENNYLGFEIDLKSNASKADLEGVFEFVRDDANIKILPPHSQIEAYIALIDSLPESSIRLGEILVAGGTLTQRELDQALAEQRQVRHSQRGNEPIGSLLIDAGVVHPEVVEAALDKQKRGEEKRVREARSVKVPSARLDDLIDQVGQLVIAGAATQLLAGQSRQPELTEAAASLLHLVENVRDTALRLRMVPIGEVFSRFPRVVRDVARELGKEIELQIHGADTELDKSMVEKIGDPLTHLVRNAIDHGIETPEKRRAQGKPASGTLRLNAFHESGCIVIEVADDGGGLDCARILNKAREKGLVATEQTLTKQEIFRLILEPGFSTAAAVTNLSGRGVGMDVVKSSVEALHGSLDIDSETGNGTTMRICLPLTLAIIDGFEVAVGNNTYILPLDAVVECIELPRSIQDDYLKLRDEVLPLIRLESLFSSGEPRSKQPATDATSRQSVVVVRAHRQKAGLVIDTLHGETQAVIKPLGNLFASLRGVSGHTILGSGRVALILDVPQLMQLAVSSPHRHRRRPVPARPTAWAVPEGI